VHCTLRCVDHVCIFSSDSLALHAASGVFLQASLTATSDQRAKLQALRMADHTLTMLSHAKMDAAGAGVFFAGDGAEALMQVL
jgi:hypothetical protein